MDALGDLAEQSLRNLIVGRILGQVDRNQQLLCLGVNIADIDTTLVCEENPVALEIILANFMTNGVIPKETSWEGRDNMRRGGWRMQLHERAA